MPWYRAKLRAPCTLEAAYWCISDLSQQLQLHQVDASGRRGGLEEVVSPSKGTVKKAPAAVKFNTPSTFDPDASDAPADEPSPAVHVVAADRPTPRESPGSRPESGLREGSAVEEAMAAPVERPTRPGPGGSERGANQSDVLAAMTPDIGPQEEFHALEGRVGSWGGLDETPGESERGAEGEGDGGAVGGGAVVVQAEQEVDIDGREDDQAAASDAAASKKGSEERGEVPPHTKGGESDDCGAGEEAFHVKSGANAGVFSSVTPPRFSQDKDFEDSNDLEGIAELHEAGGPRGPRPSEGRPSEHSPPAKPLGTGANCNLAGLVETTDTTFTPTQLSARQSDTAPRTTGRVELNYSPSTGPSGVMSPGQPQNAPTREKVLPPSGHIVNKSPPLPPLRSQGDPEHLDLATQPLRPVVIPTRPETRNTVAGEVLQKMKGTGIVPTECVSIALQNLADSSEFDDKFNTTQSQPAASSASPEKPVAIQGGDMCQSGTPAPNQFNTPSGYDSDEIVLPTPQQKVVRAGEDTPRVFYTPEENLDGRGGARDEKGQSSMFTVTARDELRALQESQPIQSEDNTTQVADPSQDVTRGKGERDDLVVAENLNRRKIQFMATMEDDRAWWNEMKSGMQAGDGGSGNAGGDAGTHEKEADGAAAPVVNRIPNDEWVTRMPHDSPDARSASGAGGEDGGGANKPESPRSAKRKLVDQSSEESKAASKRKLASGEQGRVPARGHPPSKDNGCGKAGDAEERLGGPKNDTAMDGKAGNAPPVGQKVSVEVFKKPQAKKRGGGGATGGPPSKKRKECDAIEAIPELENVGDTRAMASTLKSSGDKKKAPAGSSAPFKPLVPLDDSLTPPAPGPSARGGAPAVPHSQDTTVTSDEAATKGVSASPDVKGLRQLRSRSRHEAAVEPVGMIMASQNDASHRLAAGHGPAKRSHALSSSSTAAATSAVQGQGLYNLRKKPAQPAKTGAPDTHASKPGRNSKARPQALFAGLRFILSFSTELKKKEQMALSIGSHGGKVVDEDAGKEFGQHLKDPNCFFIANRCTRTKKYLIALATQRIPLHYSWLEDCMENLCIMPQSKYALGLGVSMFSQKMHSLTQEELKMIRPPFRGVKFHVKFHEKEAEETKKYKDIIMWAGGTVVAKAKASYILTDAMPSDGDDERIVNIDWFRQCLIHQKLLSRSCHPAFRYAYSTEPKLEVPFSPAFAFVSGRCFQVGDCVFVKYPKSGSTTFDVVNITGFNSYSRNPSFTGRVFLWRNRQGRRDGRHDSSANELVLTCRSKTYVITNDTVVSVVAMAWEVKGQLDPPHASRLTSYFCSGEMVRNQFAPWETCPQHPTGDFVYCAKTGDSLFEKDHALFRNDPERPFIGRIERVFNKNGEKYVDVKWLYRDIEIQNDGNDCFKAANPDEAEVMVHSSEFTDTNLAASILKRAFVLSKKDFSDVIRIAYDRDDAFFVGYSYQRLHDSPSECNESSFKTVDSDFDVTK